MVEDALDAHRSVPHPMRQIRVSLEALCQISRQKVIDALRRTGVAQAADDAARMLADPVDVDRLAKFCEPYGISENELISRMGGSP